MTGSNTIKNQSENSVIYGAGNTVDNSKNAVVVGKGNIGNTNSVVIGNNAKSDAENQIIIGQGTANGGAIGSIIIGNTNNTVDTSQSVLIGNNTKANGSGQGIVIIGNGAMADSNAAGYYIDKDTYIPAGIVLGEYSYSNTRAGKDGYLSDRKGDKPSTAFTDEYWNAVWKATANPMAIGNADTDANGKGQGQNGHGVLTRQITGVAAGTDLTDAVNVAQLQAAIAQFSGGESGTSGDGVHYYSVRSNEKGSDSNYDNKGAKGQNSLAAGVRASTTENAENAVAIGYGAKAEGKGATVIGQYGKATGRYALAFGGQQTDTTAEQADNVASGDNALSFGERTTASGANATAFGQETQASEKRATAFGQRTKATQSNATAFGVDTTASGMNATAFGNLTQATAIGATAFGNKNKATGQYATAWGGGDKTVDNGDGTTSKIGTVASGTYATAFGERTAASGESATAFGSDSTASGKNALAFGENSTAAGENSVAALGGTTAQNAANAAAIGKDAQAKLADSVALGSGSVADRQSGTKGYDAATGAESTQTSATWVANANAIAVGNGSTLTRQITGVAAGSQDTDAVNLAQLKEVGNLAGKHTTVSVGGQEATADGTLVKGGNLELNRKTADGQANYDVALSKDVVLGEQEEHKGGSLVVNSVAQFRTAPGSKDTYPVKEAVKIDGTTVSVVKNDGTNDQRQVVLGVGQDVGGYVALFEKTGKTPTYIFNAISSGITYLKDGKEFNRLEYGDITNGSTQFIATLDDGLKFSGDQGTDSAVKLNQKLTVTGGETNPDNLANANNIGVVSSQDRENGKLEIRLAKDLKGLTSVQTGDTTVDSNGLKIEKAGKDSKDDIIINKNTVSIAGNQITNMGSGIDGTKYTDAGDNNGANIGDVKKLADSRKTTVKSTDGSVKVSNTSTDSNHFDYNLSVDTSKVAGAVDLKYKGDNNTQGSNKLSEAVTFSGTEDQIVTQAEDGKVTFRLADDVTTQTITAVGQNGNDGQIGLTGKNGANGSVTTIIKTVGAKGTDGKDGIPGVDGQPGKDGITRLIYQDGKDGEEGTTTHTVATLDDGLKFHGDSGDIVTRKLNTQLDVLGGQTDTTKLTAASDGNIGVVSTQAADENSNGKLEIRLAKELKGLTSVQAGDTTIDGNGLKIEKAGKDSKDDIIINKNTVSIAGNQITNMGSGIDGTKYTDAGDNNGANIGDVKKLADSRKTTVKSTDGSVKVSNTSTDSNHFDYNLSVDTSKVAGAVDLKYKGDNNTQGSNKLSEAVTFSGTEDQIVTQAEDGKVTFRLADDVTTQTITAVGQNGNDGQIGLTGKNGANGSVTTIIKTVGAKGTDGKDGIPGVDGQPGKDGITRLIYDETDDKGGTEHHVVATLDDGLKFVGNDGKVVTRKLNDTLSIKGGIENKEMLADAQRVSSRNLGVRQNTAKDGLEIVMTNRPDFEAITVGPDSNPAHKITIGQQDNQAGNPNPTKGNYITGLDNTQWDAGHVVADRAATEGQLSQAITDISGKEKGGFGLADEKGGTVKKELGGTIAVKGDGTNIETKVNGDALEVSLKKDVDLTKDGSIKAGNTTINGDGVETNKVKVGDITITDQGINGGTKQITNIASGIDGKQYADAKDNNAASIGDVKQIAGEEAGKAAEAVKSKSGKNITVKDDHTVNLNDNITLGDETDASKQVVIDGNGAKVTAGDGANKVTVDGSKGQVTIGSGDKTLTLGKQANTAGDSNPAEGNYLNGLDNTKWDGEHIQSGRAATEDQLKTVSDKVNSGRVFQGDDGKEVKVGMGDTLKIQGGVKAEDVSRENNIGIVKGADDTLNIRLAKDIKGLDSVTTGNTTIDNGGLTVKTGDSSHQDITIKQGNVNMGGNKIEGVAPGKVSKDSTDAVNGSQLWQRDQAINGLSGSVNKLGNRINRVGAGAAALAALHPLDFDPDDKWDFAAGYGNYRGANAAAVGAYYRPNEDTMFSVGGSFGGGENMVNAGVSIKLGQGNHVSTSRVAMAKEMKAMRQHMAEQDALIAKLQSMHGMAVDPAKSTLFPDVAENHWAYQYVTTLAKKGILEGYPDGEFKGDRMMTRYEFAAIVYRIVESGVGSTDPELSKLVKEFSPELQYIRIDTIQKDRDGKPTIERVRVISDAK